MKFTLRTITILGMMMGLFLAHAAIASASTQRAATSYCGTPAHSVSQLRDGWRPGNPLTASAERYMKQYPGYYHIHRDQGIQNYLDSPQIEMAKTPANYVLEANTYCPDGRHYTNYPGLLAYGNHNTPSWCSVVRIKRSKSTVWRNGKAYTKITATTTKSCVPIVKDYCRNIVRGKPFPKLSQSVTYVPKVKKPKRAAPKVICPAGTVKNGAGNCVVVVVSCPAGTVVNAQGNCVTQTQTAAQACAAKGGSWDDQNQLCTIIEVSGNCSNIVVVNGNGNTVSVTQQGNCNSGGSSPPPPPPPPPPAMEYSVSCSGSLTDNKNGREAAFSADASANNGVTPTKYDWSFGASGQSVTHTFPDEHTSYTVTITVTFSDNQQRSNTCTVTTQGYPPTGGG